MSPAADLKQVNAFRLARHHLAVRLPPGSLLAAAAACGVQNSPPGSAELAFHARLEGLRPGDLQAALAVEKTLLQIYSLRSAPHIIPTRDLDVFTRGLLPGDEESMRFFIPGASEGLDQVEITLAQLIQLAGSVLPLVLDGRQLNKDDLGQEMARRMAGLLTSQQQAAWSKPSWVVAGQTTGESLARFALSLLALQGLFCLAPPSRRAAEFARLDQWLEELPPPLPPDTARTELLRRYLHAYGPSTPPHFAAWAGISLAQAAHTWKLIEGELVAVPQQSGQAWLLAVDLPDFQSPPAVKGVRLLPPHDPYLSLRDRRTLIPDPRLHRQVWRTSGNPGVVLVNGSAAALWRPNKQNNRLQVNVELFSPLTAEARTEIEAEAASLAPFKRCTRVEVAVASPAA